MGRIYKPHCLFYFAINKEDPTTLSSFIPRAEDTDVISGKIRSRKPLLLISAAVGNPNTHNAGIPLTKFLPAGIELVVLISQAQLRSFVIVFEMRSFQQ